MESHAGCRQHGYLLFFVSFPLLTGYVKVYWSPKPPKPPQLPSRETLGDSTQLRFLPRLSCGWRSQSQSTALEFQNLNIPMWSFQKRAPVEGNASAVQLWGRLWALAVGCQEHKSKARLWQCYPVRMANVDKQQFSVKDMEVCMTKAWAGEEKASLKQSMVLSVRSVEVIHQLILSWLHPVKNQVNIKLRIQTEKWAHASKKYELKMNSYSKVSLLHHQCPLNQK